MAETFSPAVNGVVNSVVRVAGALAARGHEPVVVAPSGEPFRTRDGHLVDVVRVPAIGVPGYRGLRVARPGLDLRPVLRELRPDVVHLASPALLGWSAVRAAADLDIASVAVFQTDLSGFLRRYHLRALTPALWSSLRRLHNSADLTLVPSSTTGYHLRRHGVGTLELWARGVDGNLFHPARRDERLRAEFTGGELGATVVGFVGRLAAEKRVEALAPLTRLPGVRVVVVGDGPRRRALERLMPGAQFLGLRTGTDLGRIVASLDLLVHPGNDETFCQVVQEALCAGVPVVTAAAGGLGHFAVQIARVLGASVVATASPQHHEFVHRLGAAVVIDHTQPSWPDQVRDVIDGGAQHVLACAAPTLEGAARAARDGATIATPVRAEYPDAQRVSWRQYNGQPRGSDLIRMAPWFDDGLMSVNVEARYYYENAAEAHRQVEQGHTRGKLVLIVDDDLAAEWEV